MIDAAGRPTRAALAVMVAGVVALHVGCAAVMVLGGASRWSAPTFDVAKVVLPIRWWGVIFAAVAAVLAVAAASRRTHLVGQASVAGAGLCAWWAVLLILAAEHSPTAGLLGVVLWLSAAVSHVAVAVAAGMLSPAGR